jgi:polyisoprenoid-binding protein YceI
MPQQATRMTPRHLVHVDRGPHIRLGTSLALTLATLLASAEAAAAPVTYTVDPDHTYPSFEADHMGISVWRGKMTKTSGTIVYDKSNGSGSVDITIDPDSIDFGQKQLNNWARGEQFFNTGEFPTARYMGRFDSPSNGVPTRVTGQLTLHGVTRPVNLDIAWIKCTTHPLFKREVCGADASGTFNRDEFKLGAGKDYGFKMDVNLRIQVEALAPR